MSCPILRTPFADISNSSQSNICISKSPSTQSHICQINTPPSTSQQPLKWTKTSTDLHTLGVNLISKFSEETNVYQDNDKIDQFEGAKRPCLRTPIEEQVVLSDDDVSNGELCSRSNLDNTDTDTSDSSSDSNIDEPIQRGTSLYQWKGHYTKYFDLGDPVHQCQYCGAQMWYQERKSKGKHCVTPKFQLCCGDGKIQLPYLERPPLLLQHLLFDKQASDSKNFQDNIRSYNSMFAFTSPGMTFDQNFGGGRGPPTIRLQGQTCHRIGSMLPLPGDAPKYAQLYIYDTENEVANRMQGIRNNKIDPEIVAKLTTMLDEYNAHAKSFRMARERLMQQDTFDVKLKLISDRKTDGRMYNKPTVSEVAALILGDVDTAELRDIIIQTQSGQLQRIDEFHAAYLGYQYPLIFPYGEDGYRDDICFRKNIKKKTPKRNKVTIKDWLAYRMQSRSFEAKTLLCSRRLFQQFLVDGFTMMESQRLTWLRKNQSKLRVGKYNKLTENNGKEQSSTGKSGKRVVLPSSFVGGKRYMDQLYFDGMAISAAVGFPDLFITFTCNPNWPEIQRLLKSDNLKPQDRPDLITRVFKIKFDELLKDLTKKHVLGKVLAYMYTIEFQKRGLPHAHLLIFLHPSCKYPVPEDINRIISAEIPDKEIDPELYNLVKSHMMHGPCGNANKNSPCMKDGKCSKWFPKKFQNTTIVDQDGYPVYRRRSTTHVIEKNGISLDNRFVVPYNSKLLLKYQAHINMEWCNQSTSIKYLFKYINKGYDRISATIVPEQDSGLHQNGEIDEIKQYLDCRYVSPCEAVWRILGFSIHGRNPAVERMFFHLLGQHSVYFRDYERITDVLLKPSVTESMFMSWFEANKKYPEARNLTYGQFVSKFVYVKKTRSWQPRKRGFTIGRLAWIPQGAGEIYYLRMMLTVAKGPISYDNLKLVKGIQHESFQEACYAMGFLEDDREFIEAIKEANVWGSGFFLRKLFVLMLLSGSINRPEHVWSKTKQWLCDGILYHQRILANNSNLILTDEEIDNLTLSEIENLLQANRKTLRDWKTLPYPKKFVIAQLGNKLIYDERNYDKQKLHQEFIQLYASLTDE